VIFICYSRFQNDESVFWEMIALLLLSSRQKGDQPSSVTLAKAGVPALLDNTY